MCIFLYVEPYTYGENRLTYGLMCSAGFSRSRLVETGIKTFYFLVLIAGGLMVYNSVSKLFKKYS